MSRLRLVSSLMASLLMVAGVSWFVSAAFPLVAAPQTVADSDGVTVDLGGLQLLHRDSVGYPAELARKGIQGTVAVQVRLGSDGSVIDANIVSGPDELRKTVLESVLGWHFSRGAAGTTRQISVTFRTPSVSTTSGVPGGIVTSSRSGGFVTGPTVGGSPTQTGVLRSINVRGLSDEAKRDLLNSLPVHEGDTVTEDTMSRVQAAIRAFDEHLIFGRGLTKEGDQILNITAPVSLAPLRSSMTVTGGAIPPPPPPPPAPRSSADGAPAPPKRLQIGANVQAASIIYAPKPAYPPLARQARISGVVQLHAIIGKDGTIQSLSVIAPAHPLLAPAALEAVGQWRYKPTLLNGEAVEVETTIDVNFMLAEQKQ